MVNCDYCYGSMKIIDVQKTTAKRKYRITILECEICGNKQSSTSGDDAIAYFALQDQINLSKQQDEYES